MVAYDEMAEQLRVARADIERLRTANAVLAQQSREQDTVMADQLEVAQARIAALENSLRTACDHIDELLLALRSESIRLRAVATTPASSAASAAGTPPPPAPR